MMLTAPHPSTVRRSIAGIAVIAASVIFGMAGCASDDTVDRAGTSSSPSVASLNTLTPTSAITVSREAVGKAMDRMIYRGFETSPDKGLCYADVVIYAGVSNEGLRYLTETSANTWEMLLPEMASEVGEKDTLVFQDPATISSLKDCATGFDTNGTPKFPAPRQPS